MRSMPNCWRSSCTRSLTVAGSAVLPEYTSTAMGQPWAVHTRAQTIWRLPRCRRGCSRRRPGDSSGLEVGGGDIVEQQGCVLHGDGGPGSAGSRAGAGGASPGWRAFRCRRRVRGRDGAEGGAGGVGGEAAGGGELGGGEQEASHDGSESELAGTGGQPVEEAGQAELLAEPRTAATWPWGRERRMETASWRLRNATPPLSRNGCRPRQGAGAWRYWRGPAANALAFAPGLADQNGGRTVAVGDVFDVTAMRLTWKQR